MPAAEAGGTAAGGVDATMEVCGRGGRNSSIRILPDFDPDPDSDRALDRDVFTSGVGGVGGVDEEDDEDEAEDEEEDEEEDDDDEEDDGDERFRRCGVVLMLPTVSRP